MSLSLSMFRASPWQSTADGFEPLPRGLVAREPEANALWRRGKATDQNAGAGEMMEQVGSIRRFEQSKQVCGAERFETGALKDAVEPLAVCCKPRSRRRNPIRVTQRQRGDGAGGARHRPVAEQLSPGFCIRFGGHNKANPQARQAEKLAKRAQHHNAFRQFPHRQQRKIGPHIGKSFVDNQPAPRRRPGPRERREVITRHSASVWVVGIDQNCDVIISCARVRQRGDFMHFGAASRQAAACDP